MVTQVSTEIGRLFWIYIISDDNSFGNIPKRINKEKSLVRPSNYYRSSKLVVYRSGEQDMHTESCGGLMANLVINNFEAVRFGGVVANLT